MRECIMALGTFDGVHQGHRALIAAAVRLARQQNSIPAVFTFADHPRQTLTGQRVGLLCTLSRRIELLRQAGAQVVAVENFGDICHLSPVDFVDFLIEKYRVRGLVCGKDFRFGKNGAGDSNVLGALCEEKGLLFEEVEFVLDEQGSKISSGGIREWIARGEMAKAAKALGQPFCVEGEVTHGKGLAHQWGTPTLNLPLPEQLISPRFGVYATRVTVEGVSYDGITNVGIRPTFADGTVPNVETYILEGRFDEIAAATVEFLEFIRPEQKFSDEKSLQLQIQKDIQTRRLI